MVSGQQDDCEKNCNSKQILPANSLKKMLAADSASQVAMNSFFLRNCSLVCLEGGQVIKRSFNSTIGT